MEKSKTKQIREAIEQFAADKIDYYRQWLFDDPILIKKETSAGAKRLQVVLAKVIRHFVENYERYEDLMPLTEKGRWIVDQCSARKYKIGTYRTDFVYDDEQNMKLIEITCRFALNGVFLPAVMHKAATIHKNLHLPEVQVQDPYSGVFDLLADIFDHESTIYVLKGGDTKNASKIYVDLLRSIDFDVVEVPLEEISSTIKKAKEDSTYISELSLQELEALDKPTLAILVRRNVINDLRTVFLIHDKRFFSLLYDQEFLAGILDDEEICFLNKFTIPSYTYSPKYKQIWAEARENKDRWIIKHAILGKSKEIYAGIVTDEDDWAALFSDLDEKNVMLQQWVPQQLVYGTVSGERFEDYVTGTLLYINDCYLGFGDFRTSSFPVINVVDHRKMCTLILDEKIADDHQAHYNIY